MVSRDGYESHRDFQVEVEDVLVLQGSTSPEGGQSSPTSYSTGR